MRFRAGMRKDGMEAALGSLVAYVTDSARRDFQPMNANYGLMPPLNGAARGRDKKLELGTRALAAMRGWIATRIGEPGALGWGAHPV
ncbi:MAG: hypothetical protein ACREQI_11860 [Candidatus Binataceae bacterium]